MDRIRCLTLLLYEKILSMNSKFNDNILSQPTRFIIKFSLRNHDLYSSPQSPIVSNKLFDFLHTVSISLQSDLSKLKCWSANWGLGLRLVDGCDSNSSLYQRSERIQRNSDRRNSWFRYILFIHYIWCLYESSTLIGTCFIIWKYNRLVALLVSDIHTYYGYCVCFTQEIDCKNETRR